MKSSNLMNSLITEDKLDKITDKLKAEVAKEQKDKYLELVKEAIGNDDKNNNMFVWKNSFLTIHIFIYKNLNNSTNSLIVCTKNSVKDQIITYDIMKNTNIDFRNSHDTKEQLSILFYLELVPFNEESIVYFSKSILTNINQFALDLFRIELDGISSHFQKRPIELIDFNRVRLHADKYKMAEMIDELKNPQFSAELSECLFAYENEKFYVCAAGIGGLIEHMMYLAIEKHGSPKDLRGKLTTDHYIGILKKDPFNIDNRAQNYIRNVMGFRNSVSHYNSGFTSKEICDHLFDGLKNVFINYYLNEPASIVSN